MGNRPAVIVTLGAARGSSDGSSELHVRLAPRRTHLTRWNRVAKAGGMIQLSDYQPLQQTEACAMTRAGSLTQSPAFCVGPPWQSGHERNNKRRSDDRARRLRVSQQLSVQLTEQQDGNSLETAKVHRIQ